MQFGKSSACQNIRNASSKIVGKRRSKGRGKESLFAPEMHSPNEIKKVVNAHGVTDILISLELGCAACHLRADPLNILASMR